MLVYLCPCHVGITVHQNLSVKDPEIPVSNPIYELSAVLESSVSISNPIANSHPTNSSKGRKEVSKNPHDYELAVSVHSSAAASKSLQHTRSENINSIHRPLPNPVCSSDDEINDEYENLSLDGKELFICVPSK